MITPHLKFEKEIWRENNNVCGIDEVGRGCIAGPVVAAAVVFPKNHKPIKNVRDSKKLTPKMRAEIYNQILDACEDFGIGLVAASEIDEFGINPSIKTAMRLAINMLGSDPSNLLIDAMVLSEIDIPQRSIIKGDECCYSIAAASIIAKVFRDQVVRGFDNPYPDYGFSSHKGYGTKLHYQVLALRGLTPEHRKTFLRNVNSKHYTLNPKRPEV